MLLEAINAISETISLENVFDGVFGVEIKEPPLTWEEYDDIRFDDQGNEVMTLEEAQAEYAKYLEIEMLRMKREIEILIDTLEQAVQDGIIKDTPELRAFINELSHPTVIERINGKNVIVDPGGLRERLESRIWTLQRYDFETKTLSYDAPTNNGHYKTYTTKINPDRVISDSYWTILQRQLIKLPELSPQKEMMA